jgi:hypothetical protein
MKNKVEKAIESLKELVPVTKQQSFYNKALVLTKENGDEVLFSYFTRIMTKKANGTDVRHYDSWTNTTGRHIYAFCGLHKKDFMKLPLEA